MADKLNGFISLSKIPRGMIGENKKGDKGVWVSIVPNKNGADQYGNTHFISLYNKETKETIYLGNLKPVEFGNNNAPKEVAKDNSLEPQANDLPWD